MADTVARQLVDDADLVVVAEIEPEDERTCESMLVVLASNTIVTSRVYPVTPYDRTITQVLA